MLLNETSVILKSFDLFLNRLYGMDHGVAYDLIPPPLYLILREAGIGIHLAEFG